MEKQCFEFSSYKAFLKNLVAESPQRGTVTKLATAAGCQRSYLSQVMHAHAHLTADQAYGLTKHLGFSDLETEYFLVLVDWEKAATPALKQHLANKLAAIRQEQMQVSRRVPASRIIEEKDQQLYYSSWHYAAIHIATSAEKTQTAEGLSRRLHLDQRLVEEALVVLQRCGLVSREGRTWKYAGGDIHLPKGSPLLSTHHFNWRTRAVLQSQVGAEGLHYTSVFTLGRDDLETIRRALLRFIEKVRKDVANSPADELACFNCDLFEV